ncbi:MAG: Panacea domain-containing protein [Terriglobia bacterium]
MGKLRFRFKAEKFVNAVVYLAQAIPNSTKLTICKEIYFADKEHLTRFGRTITGDTYYHLTHGQIPTRGLDMLRGRAGAGSNALFEKYVAVIGNSVHPKRQADKKVFSKSEIDVLNEIIGRFKNLPATRIRKLAHDEASFKESQDGCPIDFDLFFRENPKSASVKIFAEREQEARDVLRVYAAE